MKAMIVDDEPRLRNVLTTKLPWASFGFTDVVSAENGLGALEEMERAPADLVITDVRMPRMGGVELARVVRERWPECQLIFLSGFGDRETLKAAIHVRALDFIDKPIDLAAIEKFLAGVARELIARKEKRTQKEQQAKRIQVWEPHRRQWVAAMALGLAEAPHLDGELGLCIGPWHVALLGTWDREGGQAWSEKVATELNSLDHAVEVVGAVVEGAGRVAVLLTSGFSDLAGLWEGWIAPGGRIPGSRLQVGISPVCRALEDLPRALIQARTALADGFYRADAAVLLWKPADRPPFVVNEAQKALLKTSLRGGDLEGTRDQIRALGAATRRSRDPDLDRVLAAWMEVAEILTEAVTGWGNRERKERLERFGADLRCVADPEGLIEVTINLHDRLLTTSLRDLAVRDRVTRAKAYMELHHERPDLSIEEVASWVGVTDSYLSLLFREAIGVTAKEYLTQYRIDRAKAILWESYTGSMMDLATKIGFRDPAYFCTVFRKITGTSPSQFQKRALG